MGGRWRTSRGPAQMLNIILYRLNELLFLKSREDAELKKKMDKAKAEQVEPMSKKRKGVEFW